MADVFGGGQRGSGTGEGVQDDAFLEWQGSADELAEESLRLERGVRSEALFGALGRAALDDIAEGLCVGDPTETTSAPFSEIVLYAPLKGVHAHDI